MAYLQEMLLIIVTFFNYIVISHAVRVYKFQPSRIDSMKDYIDDIQAENFVTIENMVRPIKGYI